VEKIDVRSTDQPAEENAGAAKFKKSRPLRLEKQVIRTLTGAELKLVGGGGGDVTETITQCRTVSIIIF
jgi:hypothetical protein